MSAVEIIIQLLVSLTILNVWLFRRHKASNYRCADARNLKDEFRSYGFPVWVYFAVGPLKVLTATAMIISIWLPFTCLVKHSINGIYDACSGHLSSKNVPRSVNQSTARSYCTCIVYHRSYFKVARGITFAWKGVKRRTSFNNSGNGITQSFFAFIRC